MKEHNIFKYTDRRNYGQMESYFLNLTGMLHSVLAIIERYGLVDMQLAEIIYEWVTEVNEESGTYTQASKLKRITAPLAARVLVAEEFIVEHFTRGDPKTFIIYVPGYDISKLNELQK
jgi:hypothetical protein